MMKKERLQANVELIHVGAGATNRTAQYGAEYKFKTSDGIVLYWDTTCVLDLKKGEKVDIGFTVAGKISNNVYDVKNVRIKK